MKYLQHSPEILARAKEQYGDVSKFTDLLNGQISVRSELGKGSSFTVTIPCAAETQTSAADCANTAAGEPFTVAQAARPS